MSPSEPHDPWSSLADSLGLPGDVVDRRAAPESPAAPPTPQQSAAQPRTDRAQLPPAAPAAMAGEPRAKPRGDWSSLASELGLEPAPEPQPPASATGDRARTHQPPPATGAGAGPRPAEPEARRAEPEARRTEAGARPAAGAPADLDAFSDADAFRFDVPRSRRGSAAESPDVSRSGRPASRQSQERAPGARSDRRPADPSELRPRTRQPEEFKGGAEVADDSASLPGDRGAGHETPGEEGGEERRRGRRGGRRRRRRSGERTGNFRADAETDLAGSFSPEAILDDIRPIDEPLAGVGDQIPDRDLRGFRERADSAPRGEDHRHGDDFDHPADRLDNAEADRIDFDPESGLPRESDPDSGEGEPRKRRRRGRRGGRRRRGRSSSGESGEILGGRDEEAPGGGTAAVEPRDTDDEPLRSGYMGEVARTGSESARRADAVSDGDRGRRGRRGRSGRGRRADGSGEGGDRRPAAERQPSESAGRGRDSAARNAGRQGEGSRRGSRSDQGRRSRGGDFKPVGGSLHEDDEGLELLSADEAGSSGRERPSSREEDDVFVESGLADVLDVPSWVEAIGIVIAGNLEARSRPARPENRGR